MTEAWRLAKSGTVEKAFDGEGAQTYGGRWNRKGTRVVYAAGTLSLCVLEALVHLDTDLLPMLHAYQISIPDRVTIETLRENLPAGWDDVPAPEVLQEIGSQWVESATSCVLRVPSAVIRMEWNFLINPAHTDFNKLLIRPPEDFVFDPRLERR